MVTIRVATCCILFTTDPVQKKVVLYWELIVWTYEYLLDDPRYLYFDKDDIFHILS